MKKIFVKVRNAVAVKIPDFKSVLTDRRGEGFVDTAIFS